MPRHRQASEQSDLAVWLRQQRLTLGFSQAGLARRVGCSRQYIAQLESGARQHPSAEVSYALARALQVEGAERTAVLARLGHRSVEHPPREPGEVNRVAAALLDAIPFPALLHDSCWQVVQVNRAAALAFQRLTLPARQGVSLLDVVFDPRHRPRFPSWEPWARYLLAQFKRDSLPVSRTSAHQSLLRHLRAYPDFLRLWRHVDPADDQTPLMPIQYRLEGGPMLSFTLTRMQFAGTPHLWGIVFMPDDEAAQALLGV